MLFKVEFFCDTPPFSEKEPRDLLHETARILKELAKSIEDQQFDILGTSKRQVRDADGNVVGTAGFG